MPYRTKQILACASLVALLWSVGGCAPKRIPVLTVDDLIEDRVTLDGILLKCNQTPSKARSEAECANARIAVERLAKDVDPAEEARRNAEFERSREKLRLAEEHVRQEREAKNKVDPYNLPVVPVEPAPPPNGGVTPSP